MTKMSKKKQKKKDFLFGKFMKWANEAKVSESGISENEKNARQAEQFLKKWRTRLWRSGKQENRNLRVEKSKGLESNRNENDGRNR